MKFIEALDSITDPNTYRRISLMLITALCAVSWYGFTVLDSRITEVKDANTQMQRQLTAEITIVREQHINRTEWTEIDRRISMYFEQLDRRLDRIENRLERQQLN